MRSFLVYLFLLGVVFRCEDHDGVLHFTDTPPKNFENNTSCRYREFMYPKQKKQKIKQVKPKFILEANSYGTGEC